MTTLVFDSYGFGLYSIYMSENLSLEMWGHSGAVWGSTSEAYCSRDGKNSAVFMTNSYGDERSAVDVLILAGDEIEKLYLKNGD